ncbi:cysteine synthase [Acidobacteria bacterium Mor1]|nr:cysteine synthase [Acidobacteria bacterium Mor1]
MGRLPGGRSQRPSTEFNAARRIHVLRHMVGNTPLLEIELRYRGEPRRLYAKAENLNMTGSIKDRMVLHILRKACARGVLPPGRPIVEATSGNTGIAVAGIGKATGHPVTIFMPDWMSSERTALIRCLGADIRLVPAEEGGFIGAIQQAESYAAEIGAFLPRQFRNEDNIDAHRTATGPEIFWQLRYHGLSPDAFVAGVGTGGTVMGVGHFLREMDPRVKLHPLEPAGSPTLRTGHKVGEHRIQGISDEFIPPIVDLEFLDGVVDVEDGDAILMAQRLAADLGLGVGISSGANLLGALKLQNLYGPGSVIATVFPDSNKKYLSTDLMKREPIREGYLTPDVQLLAFDAFKRSCRTCSSS